MSESMDKYYKDLVSDTRSAGATVGSAAAMTAAPVVLPKAAKILGAKKAVQKKAKGGVVRKMKKGGAVK